MLPSQVIAKTTTPDSTEICLVRRGDEWSIRVGSTVLMSSRQHASEEALAELPLKLVPHAGQVLVGGLGLGYTLRAVLNRLGSSSRVTVAELLPELVEWNRTHVGLLNEGAILDRRCEVIIGDVYSLILRSSQIFDAILLDVDNGPIALADAGNQRLYSEKGVRACWAALRPKGVFAVWSAGQSPSFDALLSRIGFKVTTTRVKQAPGARACHVLHIGQRD